MYDERFRDHARTILELHRHRARTIVWDVLWMNASVWCLRKRVRHVVLAVEVKTRVVGALARRLPFKAVENQTLYEALRVAGGRWIVALTYGTHLVGKSETA